MRCRLSPTTAILGLALALLAYHAASAQAAGPHHLQASPPAIQLAAAFENEFDGKWEGTFFQEKRCVKEEIPIKATIKDGEFSAVVKNKDYQNELEGSVSNDGRLSFWDRFEFIDEKHGPAVHSIKITGKFTINVFQGAFTLKRDYGHCEGEIKMARVGSGAQKLGSASRSDLIAALQTQQPATRRPSASEASKDSAFWGDIKYSSRVSDFQRYLEKYPDGLFVALAENQIRDLVKRQSQPGGEALASAVAGIKFGTYHALVIGIDNYKELPKLKTAVKDAKAVAAALETDYGFKVRTLLDPGRDDIIDAFDDYMEQLTYDDNLLIYYAGHGWLDEATDRGYWLPANAKPGRRSKWLSNSDITDTLKSLAAKHVMVVADSCYSGTLTRSATVDLRDANYLKRMASKMARVAMVSGGLEPVADSGGSGNSPFAKAFLDALRNNPDVIDGTRLFGEIRRPVILNAQQTPEYSDVRNSGHDGGDFLFVRKK